MTKVFPFDYTQKDFPNGLRLLTVPTPFPHIVALYIVVQVGSRNETEPGKSGFAHLFEHMMFRGTERFSPEAYDAVLKQAGAAQNAYTDDDLTAYHTTFTREDLPKILEIEADRFQNLQYTEDAFRTESRAVLAEYNKDSAEPVILMDEKLREAAFATHPYRHTTMGFLADVQRMPELYDFSRLFHDRYYRPEYTTLIVCGDVEVKETEALVEKYWAPWQRGSFVDAIPEEPAFLGPKDIEVPWPSPTMPMLTLAFRGPAFTDTAKDSAALDVLSYLAFSPSSPLYEKLVLVDQACDHFHGYCPDHADPFLYLISARLKDESRLSPVREAVLATLEELRRQPVEEARLERVKTHLRYAFAMQMNESEAIASVVARYVALRRTPETINSLYEQYAAITPADLLWAAQRYFNDANRLSVTLRHRSEKAAA